MTDLGLKSFDKLYPMLIHKYKDLIVDQNATEKDKINQIIVKLNALGKLSNDVVRDWNTVYQWAMNDGLTQDVNNKLEAMKANGEFDTLVATVVALIGDLSTLETTAKDTVVHALNEVDELAKSNQTKIGDLTTLNTSDKDTLVHAINDNVSSITKLGDLTTLQTADKDTLVHAINDNVVSLGQLAILSSNYTTLQLAINDAIAKKKALKIVGNYTVDTPLNINSNIVMIGDGKLNSVINFTGTGSLFNFNGSNFFISNFAIKGKGDNTNDGITLDGDCRSFTIDNIEISLFSKGITFLTAYAGMVQSCEIHDNDQGIYKPSSSSAGQLRFINNFIYSNNKGAYFENVGVIDFIGNNIEINKISGLEFNKGIDNCYALNIIGNNFESNTQVASNTENAVVIGYSKGVNIQGNQFRNIGANSISILSENSKSVVIGVNFFLANISGKNNVISCGSGNEIFVGQIHLAAGTTITGDYVRNMFSNILDFGNPSSSHTFYQNASNLTIQYGGGDKALIDNQGGYHITDVGEFFANGAGKGLILKTPDGLHTWRISIDNTGTVISTNIN